MEIFNQNSASIIALVISALALLDKWYGKSAKMQRDISDLRTKIASLETKIEPFWAMIERHLPDLLKQPIHLEMDALLSLYQKGSEQMSTEELIALEADLLKAKEEAKLKKDPRMIGYVWMAGIVSSRILERKIKQARESRPKERKWYVGFFQKLRNS